MNQDIENDYKERMAGRSGSHLDINEHLETLSVYASKCRSIVEFGTRTGNSTVALLHGLESQGNGILHSFDINDTPYKPPSDLNAIWKFTKADTSLLEDIPICDMLFIDTLHTADQVRAELKFAYKCNKYIFLHDTVTFGDKGENGQDGITRAIYEFLADNTEWRVMQHWSNNNGLLGLVRFHSDNIFQPNNNQT
jgi:hypothetical protein